MSGKLILFVYFPLFAAYSLLLGRWLGGCLGSRLLTRRCAESTAFAAIFGTAASILVAGSLFHLGLTAPHVLIGLLGFFGLAGVGCRARSGSFRLSVPSPTGLLLCAVALMGSLLLTRLVWEKEVLVYENDVYTYLAVSESLQRNPFPKPIEVDPRWPLEEWQEVHRIARLRIGASFLHAVVQAAMPEGSSWRSYPIVLAWGCSMNFLAIYLLCRWGLRVPRSVSLLAAWVAATTFNPLHASAYMGFLPQQYGTAFLATLVAVLNRCRASSTTRAGATTAVVAPVAAALVTSYSEISPVAFGVLVGAAFLAFLRDGRRAGLRACFRSQLILAATILGFCHVEIGRAFHALVIQADTVVGSSLRWNALEYGSFALGGSFFYIAYPLEVFPAVSVLLSLLLALGFLRMARRREGAVVLGTLTIFALLVVYFATVKRDPFTGEIGHRWNLFKLAKWVYPCLLPVVAFGFASIVPSRFRVGILVSIALTVTVCAIPSRRELDRKMQAHVQFLSHVEKPLLELDALRKRYRDLNRSAYCLPQIEPYHAAAAELALYPMPFDSPWVAIPNYSFTPRSPSGNPLPRESDLVLHSSMRLHPPTKNRSTLDVYSDPAEVVMLASINAPNALESGPGEPNFWVGGQRAIVEIFARRDVRVEWRFQTRPGPCGSDAGTRTLLVFTDEFPEGKQLVVAPGAKLGMELPLRAGVNRIELVCPDPLVRLYGNDPRDMLLGIGEIQLHLVGE